MSVERRRYLIEVGRVVVLSRAKRGRRRGRGIAVHMYRYRPWLWVFFVVGWLVGGQGEAVCRANAILMLPWLKWRWGGAPQFNIKAQREKFLRAPKLCFVVVALRSFAFAFLCFCCCCSVPQAGRRVGKVQNALDLAIGSDC